MQNWCFVGCAKSVHDYIWGIGVKLREVFARLGTTESQFVRVVQPYVDKFENPSDVMKIFIEAILLAAWDAGSKPATMSPSTSVTTSIASTDHIETGSVGGTSRIVRRLGRSQEGDQPKNWTEHRYFFTLNRSLALFCLESYGVLEVADAVRCTSSPGTSTVSVVFPQVGSNASPAPTCPCWCPLVWVLSSLWNWRRRHRRSPAEVDEPCYQ